METSRPDEARPEVKTTKKLAAMRQIAAAIEHFHKQEFECSITLAAAAEGILPPTDDPHLFQDLKADKADMTPEEYKLLNPNLVVNWLKHHKTEDPDEVVLTEFETVLALLRAITKFIAFYHQSTKRLEGFLEWVGKQGVPGYPVYPVYEREEG